MKNFITSVCNWNSLRYDQIENKPLNIALLTEEFLEFINKNDTIDLIDALVDMMYINIGAIYKMGYSADEIYSMINQFNYKTEEFSELKIIGVGLYKYIKSKNSESNKDALVELFHRIYTALNILLEFPGEDLINQLMMTVCAANDTKSIPSEKVDASVKANTDKGENFVPPEEAMKQIIKENIKSFINIDIED